MSAINSHNLTALDGRDPYIPCGFFLKPQSGTSSEFDHCRRWIKQKQKQKQKHTKIQLLYFEDVEL